MKNRFKDLIYIMIIVWLILVIGNYTGKLIFFVPIILMICVMLGFSVLMGPQPERKHVVSLVLSIILLTLTIVVLARYLIWHFAYGAGI